MNEFIFVVAYLATAFMGLFGFIIVPIVSIWIGLVAGEVFHLPFAGTARKFWQKWLIMWPLKKLWGFVNKAGGKFFAAAWRGFVIVTKRLFAAAGRGAKIVWSKTRARLRGTP